VTAIAKEYAWTAAVCPAARGENPTACHCIGGGRLDRAPFPLLLILNLPLVGAFVSILRTPRHILSTFVLLLCLIGAFSLNSSHLDLWVLVGTGLLGYAFRKLSIDPAPLIVAVVLGPVMEKTLRQTLFMAHGDWRLLVFRPLSLTLFVIGALVLLGPPIVGALRRRAAVPATGAGTVSS
jgi:putative tricarboxylic transport membrane protein